MPVLTIHPAEHCALASKPCALHVLANGVPACAHPALGYPIDAGTEMPKRCPCDPPPPSPSQIGAARRSAKWRGRWS